MNEIFEDIKELFCNAGICDFAQNPADRSERGKFASLYNEFHNYMESARIQGFTWDMVNYEFENNNILKSVEVKIDYITYKTITQRYRELFVPGTGDGNGEIESIYNISGYITEIDTEKIDTNYMNTRFEKYLRVLEQKDVNEMELEKTLNELHKSFASLTQDEQKYANIFLHDIERGNVEIKVGKTFRDYITEYQSNARNEQLMRFANTFDIDYTKLENLMSLKVTEKNINEYGRFDELLKTVNYNKAKKYFEQKGDIKLSDFEVNVYIDEMIRDFILSGGFEVK